VRRRRGAGDRRGSGRAMTAEKLTVRDLQVAVRRTGQELVRGVSFDVEPGSSFGFVGETSSGKSLTCRAVISLLPVGLQSRGDIFYGGTRLAGLGWPEPGRECRRPNSLMFPDPRAPHNATHRATCAV